jgi:ABC-type sugar transport system ATPase subunit
MSDHLSIRNMVDARSGLEPDRVGTILTVKNLSKRFQGVIALDDVSFSVARGEAHALLGENGAGKSTLLKVLSGAEIADAGHVLFDGHPVSFAHPLEAQRAGIATIYQEFTLFPDLTVAENLFAGHLPRTRLGLVDRATIARVTAATIEKLGASIDPGTVVSRLSVAEQQLVEIARALTLKSRLIIMDEPTAALGRHEVERLTSVINDLKAHGVSVVFVSHRLEEVVALADRYTVLRDGRLAGTGRLAETDAEGLVRLMIGRNIERVHSVAAPSGPPILKVEALSSVPRTTRTRGPQITEADFELYRGEILGLAGLVGAGRTELARMLFGADPAGSGRLLLDDAIFAPRSPRDAIRAGFGFVPEDRKQQALFLELAVTENFALPGNADRPGGSAFLRRQRERAKLETFRHDLSIRIRRPSQPIGTLSGGNQQKVVLARWLGLAPKILVVDEPTRGIDIAAKADVHRLLRRIADKGVAVLLISSDLPEVLAISDRILTLRAGRVTGNLKAADTDEETLMRLMALDLNLSAPRENRRAIA